MSKKLFTYAERIQKPKKIHNNSSEEKPKKEPVEDKPFNTLEYLHASVGNNNVARLLKEGIIQPKMLINQASDKYEIEANRVALELKSNIDQNKGKKDTPGSLPSKEGGPKKVNISTGSAGVQKKENSAPAPAISRVSPNTKKQKETGPAAEKEIKNLSTGGGNPIDNSTKKDLNLYFTERNMNVDLNNVRIHSGQKASEIAAPLNARAFTYKNQIVFGKGAPTPGTKDYSALMAHEVTHTIQQGGVNTNVIQREVETAEITDEKKLEELENLDELENEITETETTETTEGSETGDKTETTEGGENGENGEPGSEETTETGEKADGKKKKEATESGGKEETGETAGGKKPAEATGEEIEETGEVSVKGGKNESKSGGKKGGKKTAGPVPGDLKAPGETYEAFDKLAARMDKKKDGILANAETRKKEIRNLAEQQKENAKKKIEDELKQLTTIKDETIKKINKDADDARAAIETRVKNSVKKLTDTAAAQMKALDETLLAKQEAVRKAAQDKADLAIAAGETEAQFIRDNTLIKCTSLDLKLNEVPPEAREDTKNIINAAKTKVNRIGEDTANAVIKDGNDLAQKFIEDGNAAAQDFVGGVESGKASIIKFRDGAVKSVYENGAKNVETVENSRSDALTAANEAYRNSKKELKNTTPQVLIEIDGLAASAEGQVDTQTETLFDYLDTRIAEMKEEMGMLPDSLIEPDMEAVEKQFDKSITAYEGSIDELVSSAGASFTEIIKKACDSTKEQVGEAAKPIVKVGTDFKEEVGKAQSEAIGKIDEITGETVISIMAVNTDFGKTCDEAITEYQGKWDQAIETAKGEMKKKAEKAYEAQDELLKEAGSSIEDLVTEVKKEWTLWNAVKSIGVGMWKNIKSIGMAVWESKWLVLILGAIVLFIYIFAVVVSAGLLSVICGALWTVLVALFVILCFIFAIIAIIAFIIAIINLFDDSLTFKEKWENFGSKLLDVLLAVGDVLAFVKFLRVAKNLTRALGSAAKLASTLRKVNGVMNLMTLMDKVGDLGKVIELLDKVNDGKKLLQLVNNFKNAGNLSDLLNGTNKIDALIELSKKVNDSAKLTEMLQLAKCTRNPEKLIGILDNVRNVDDFLDLLRVAKNPQKILTMPLAMTHSRQLAAILSKTNKGKHARMLQLLSNADDPLQMLNVLNKVDQPAAFITLLKKVENPAQMFALLDKMSDPGKLVSIMSSVDDPGKILNTVAKLDDPNALVTLLNKVEEAGKFLNTLGKYDNPNELVGILSGFAEPKKMLSLLDRLDPSKMKEAVGLFIKAKNPEKIVEIISFLFGNPAYNWHGLIGNYKTTVNVIKEATPLDIKEEDKPIASALKDVQTIVNALKPIFGIPEVPMEAAEVQPKLKVGGSNNSFEKEADSIAENVVKSSSNKEETGPQKVSSVSLQGTTGKGIGAKSPIHNLSGGSSFGHKDRSFFENSLGADFKNIKIHTGSNAHSLASSINARAFTKGNNIVFSQGEYQPGTTEGKKLIAHELVHTIQQSGGNSKIVQRWPWSSKDDEEKEEAVAEEAAQTEETEDKTLPGNFNAEKEAEKLKEAFGGGWDGTDERAVIDILWTGRADMTRAIENAFNQLSASGTLEQKLHEELSGKDLERAIILLGHGKLGLSDKLREIMYDFVVKGKLNTTKLYHDLERAAPAELSEVNKDTKLIGQMGAYLPSDEWHYVQAFLNGGNGILAAKLLNAVSGWGTDEKAIWLAIEQASEAERQFIQGEEKILGAVKADLNDEEWIQFEKSLTGTFNNLDRIEMATMGWGTDEAALMASLKGMSQEEFNGLSSSKLKSVEDLMILLDKELSGADYEEAKQVIHQKRLAYDNVYKEEYLARQIEAHGEDEGMSVLVADTENGESVSVVGKLKIAAAGAGTDEKTIWHTLNSLSEAERNFILKNPEGVLDTLEDDLSKSDYEKAMGILAGGSGSVKIALAEAINGWGTDERLIYDAIDKVLREGGGEDILADQRLLFRIKEDLSPGHFTIFKSAIKNSEFTPMKRLEWATIAAAGTDEDLVYELCAQNGANWYDKDKNAAIDDVDKILQKELSTSDYWRALDSMRPEPASEEERIARGKENLERERGDGNGLSVAIMDSLSYTGENADDAWREYRATYNQAIEDNELTEEEKERIGKDASYSAAMTEEYKAAKESVAHWASTIAVAIVGTIATILTAGAAGPLVLALGGKVLFTATAMVTAAALKVGINEAIRGEGYDALGTQGLVDALSASVEVGLSVVGGQMAAKFMQGLGKTALVKSIAPSIRNAFGQAGTNILSAGIEGSIDATIGGIGEGIIMGLANEETWANGVEGFFTNMAKTTASTAAISALTGFVTGAGFKSITEAVGNAKVKGQVPDEPTVRTDDPNARAEGDAGSTTARDGELDGNARGNVDNAAARVASDADKLRSITGYKPADAVDIIENKFGFVYDSTSQSWKKGGKEILFDGGRWQYKNGNSTVAEWTILSSHRSRSGFSSQTSGRKSFFQSHHGIQNDWAKKRLVGYYNPEDMPTILLRDSHSNTPHRLITNNQTGRKGGIMTRSFKRERLFARNELLEAGVPVNVADQYLNQTDTFFKGIYDRMTQAGDIASRDAVFGNFQF